MSNGKPRRPLADHLAWLESIGTQPCTCRYEWKSPGRGEMPGWVRMNTEPGCLEHGKAHRA